jgi:hypothetical protein
MKTSSIHPALQLEEKGIIIEDWLKSQRRITLPDGTFADIHLREGIHHVYRSEARGPQ